jgi:hypothetical protein
MRIRVVVAAALCTCIQSASVIEVVGPGAKIMLDDRELNKVRARA